jgi:uncharacterized membrane protein
LTATHPAPPQWTTAPAYSIGALPRWAGVAACYDPRALPDLLRPVLLLHVLSAFVYGAGYVGTNMLTEIARRTADVSARRHALRFSNEIDRLNQVGGTLTGITGVAALVVFGYSLLTPWIVAATTLYAAIVATGILFWGNVGRAVDRAMSTGDDAGALALLRSPRNIAVSRTENFAFVVLIALMVLRPGS